FNGKYLRRVSLPEVIRSEQTHQNLVKKGERHQRIRTLDPFAIISFLLLHICCYLEPNTDAAKLDKFTNLKTWRSRHLRVRSRYRSRKCNARRRWLGRGNSIACHRPSCRV